MCVHLLLALYGVVECLCLPFSPGRVIFPTRRKEVTDEEIVHKTFIISSGSFAFGPLHCGRPRERLDSQQGSTEVYVRTYVRV